MKNLLTLFVILNYISCYSQYSEKLFEQSILEYENGRLAKADSLISQSIDLERNNRKVDYLKYYNRGIFRQQMDSINKAIQDFDTVIYLKKDFYPALENRAVCYYFKGELMKSDVDIDQLIKVKGDYLEAFVLSAIVNIELKNYKKSILACSKGLALKKDPRFYLYRSICNIKLDKYQFSLKDIEMGEKYFGTSNTNILEARLYYYFVTKSPIFCSVVDKLKAKENYTLDFLNEKDLQKKFESCDY
jgi:tetratricopeptide (TPR) repeat protein